MSSGKPVSYDDEDYDLVQKPRKGSHTFLWVMLGFGGIVVLVLGGLLIFASREMKQVRMAHAQAEEARIQAENAAHKRLAPPIPGPKMPVHEPPMDPPIEEMRRWLPERLKGSQLTPIRKDQNWSFTFLDESFVLESGKEPLPSDLQVAFLGPDQKASTIEGKWRLEEGNRVLVFSAIQANGKKRSGEVKLAIEPAGVLRVNMGDYQYNIFGGGP